MKSNRYFRGAKGDNNRKQKANSESTAAADRKDLDRSIVLEGFIQKRRRR
jgi:hypothetical protein